MSPRSWKIRIEDMLTAIVDAENVIRGKSFVAFQKDKTSILACLACVQIIGEACHHIPDQIKDQYQDVPWKEIRGMRNRIIHEYFDLDEELLWQTVVHDLPQLKKNLEKLR